MKKILLIGPFPDPISGVSLANKIVFDVLDKDANYETDIINTSYPHFDEHVGYFSFQKLIFFLKINIMFYKIFKVDIVYITPGQTFFGITKYSLFILLSFILKKELIIHVHGNHLGDCYRDLSGIKKKVLYFLVSKFSKGIVLSKSLRYNLAPFLGEDEIYNLPNFAENYLTDTNLKKDFKELHLVFLSNLMYEKGIIVLLDALKKLEQENIIYKAKIAGNIDESLKKTIQSKLDILKNTEYLGVVRGNEKKELLEWSNTFVLPTFYKMEGQPISVLEAMATKNTIVTTEHAGICDIINNENGFFVKKNDVISLTNTLIKLSQNLEEIEKISENNYKYFKRNFTIDIFENKLLKIFNV